MSEAQAPDAAPPPAASAGALLRAAREHAGLPLDEFAALLKVTIRRVELIEADQFDQLPDPVFVRALAQTMCRTLKIDPAPVLALLPQTPTRRLGEINVGLNATFREGPTQLLPDDWWGKLLPFLGGAALLVAAALLFYFLPSNWQAPPKVSPRAVTAAAQPPAAKSTAAQSPAAAPQTVSPVLVAPPGSGSAPAPSAPAAPALERGGVVPADVARAAPIPAPAPQATAAPAPRATPAPARAAPPVTAVVPAPAASVGAAAPAAAAAVTAVARMPAAAPAGLLQLRTSEAAWVQVQDAQGVLLLSRELRAGEAVGLDGATPLKVTVGNVRATQIAFRGKAMDLRSFTRDNVARIELQ